MIHDEATARAMLVQTKYTEQLLRIPHVVGVAIGLRQRGGEYTAEVCLVVLVDQKLPVSELDSNDLIPHELDGVPVDVQEIGQPQAYS
ncbi:MAG: hypothetical protein J0L63_00490 [Anaerolineae bacterium]|nr:hypothetical protein [Anaerolineae bacterium]